MNHTGNENKNENYLIDLKNEEINEKLNKDEENIIEFEESNMNKLYLDDINKKFEANVENKEQIINKEDSKEINKEVNQNENDSISNLNSFISSNKSFEKQIISFDEKEFPPMRMDQYFIKENFIDKNNKKTNLDLNQDNQNENKNQEDENSLILNHSHGIFEAESEEFQRNYIKPKKTLSKINVKKFDADYSNNDSFADDIKIIPSSKISKSNFFYQIKKKTEENNYFIPKNFTVNKNINISKNISLFDDNSKNYSIQDQLISFNNDLEGCGIPNITAQNNSLSRNSNFKMQNENKTSFSSSNLRMNKDYSNSNSSYNLNSTNQSIKKSSKLLQDKNYIQYKDKFQNSNTNLSNLEYKKY
jgi:hypothetical protein